MAFDPQFETQLSKLLENGESPREISAFFLREIREGRVTAAQVEQAAWFFSNGKCVEELTELVRFLLMQKVSEPGAKQPENTTQNRSQKPKIPWGPLLSSLVRDSSDKITEEFLTQIFTALEADDQLESITFSPLLNLNLARTKELKIDLEQTHKEHLASQRQAALDQAERFSVDRLYEEEMETLLRLEKMYPGDKEVGKRLKSFAMRQAKDVIASRKRRTFESELDDDIPKLMARKEVEPLALSIAEALIRAAEKDSSAAYDLSVALLQMDFPEQALKALSFATTSHEHDWLKIEILLETRRFVAVLELARALEIKYADDPEAMFSVMYARARAMWGLHRSHEAIDMLSRIVQVRPNYRSAHALLLTWKERLP